METNGSTSQPSEVTLYISQYFVSGLLKGITYHDTMPFASVNEATAWANLHKTVPVKSWNRGGSNYIVSDFSFQSFAR